MLPHRSKVMRDGPQTMRGGLRVGRDDLRLPSMLREVIEARNRSWRRVRDARSCRADSRAGRIKAMGRGFELGRHEWQKIGLRVSLMAGRF